MAGRIQSMRALLRQNLEQLGSPLPWNHVTDQIGMFCEWGQYGGGSSSGGTYGSNRAVGIAVGALGKNKHLLSITSHPIRMFSEWHYLRQYPVAAALARRGLGPEGFAVERLVL